jgi:hypothetical protein
MTARPTNVAADASVRRSRRQMCLLIGVFLAPLLAAFLLYYGGSSAWRPAGRTNHGELIDPARPLPQVELRAPGGAKLDTSAAFRGKWNLVYIGDGRCDARCREALVLMRQTRLALNDDMTRVQRFLLVAGNCCDQTYLDAEHPGLTVALIDDAAGKALLTTFPDGQSAMRHGAIFIVDPLGNLMMSYGAGVPQKGLLEDLKKLLKLSHIG